MLVITGARSAIVQSLLLMLPVEESTLLIRTGDDIPLTAERYLFCAGLLRSIPHVQQTAKQKEESRWVNAGYPIECCDKILDANADARICVVGSESAFRGSYDATYATAKESLHRYVEVKEIKTPAQQLVAVSPSIIGDAGMTTRRTDTERLAARMAEHPKRRFLKACEVARLIHFLLYVDEGYISGTVVRMHGGG